MLRGRKVKVDSSGGGGTSITVEENNKSQDKIKDAIYSLVKEVE